jgi:4-amino-4-deoxy-L-arabinose transferase-like glycosyltransferase
MFNRYRRIGRTSGSRRIAGTWRVSEFSAQNSSTDTHSLPDGETAPNLGTLDRTTPPFGQIFSDKVPGSWVVGLAAILFVYLFTCGAPRLFDQIDGQYAGAAREMMARGDWLVPTQNGVPRLQKPPLVYWCEALSMSVLGVNEFAARLPVALATVGWFLATGLLARRVIGTWTAGIAGTLILSMFTGTFFFTHLVMPEPFLGCFMTLSFWSLLKAMQVEEIPDRKGEVDRWLMVAWTFIALSTLTKGIHGLLIPMAALSCTAWLRPSIRGIWRRFILRPDGWILFLALLAPWYLAIECRYPGFLMDHFFNEQIGSALSRRWPPDSDRVPLWIFWPEHLVLLFPISLLFPAAIRASLQRQKNRRPWLNEEGLLLLSWFLVVALGISFANIQDYYLMIAWAPLAIWISWVIARNVISYKWPAVVVSLLGASGLVVVVWVAVSRGSLSSQTASSTSMIGDTILNVFQVLPPTVWKEIVPLLGTISTASLVTGILVFLFDRQGKSELCLAGFALLMAVIFAIGARGMQVVEDEFSSAKVAELISARDSLPSVVIVQSDPNISTTLFFYLHQPVYWVDGHPNIEFATRTLGIGLDYYLTREQVAKTWGETKRVFLVIEGSALAEWKAYLGLSPEPSNPIGRCGSRVILVNR